MKQKFRLIYSVFTFVLFASLFISFSGGYDSNAAGAPNEGTCSNCHGGGSTENASVSLVDAPSKFTQGQTYALTLNVNHPTAPEAGFQIVATNGANGAMVGSFTAGSGSRLTSSGRLTHNAPNSLSGKVASWTFNWTAPASGAPSNVVFYYVGNAVNGNGGTSGDAVLTANSSTVLPIELLSFSGTRGKNKSVNLVWSTASERNNAYFVVERSVDNQEFEAIGRLKGRGNAANVSTYQLSNDVANLTNSVVYYRLQQVDFDGKATYSKVISVDIESKAALKIYPSLAKRGDVLQVEASNSATIEVLNVSGQVVQTVQRANYAVNGKSDKTTFNVSTVDLTLGRYFVRMIDNGLVTTSSFVVL